MIRLEIAPAVAGIVVAAVASSASAVGVRVTVTGDVEFNQIQGNQAGVTAGDPVRMSFTVDSDDFLDSPDFPTRGYAVDLPSFELTVGGNPIVIADPQPFGPAYFVLRDDDPVADGFLLSRNLDLPQPVTVNIPGLNPDHELNFLATYGDGDALASLDILDAVGTYNLAGISVFGWDVGRFGNAGALYNYESLTIAVVPEPASAALLATAGLAGLLRRRR